MTENIIYNDELPVGRRQKENRLNQQSCALWMTGLSGSGKTTLALGLEKKLFKAGFVTQILDGDLVRKGINNNLGFSQEDRVENIRRISEITKLFVQSGIITINCFISPTNEIREMAKQIIGKEDFIEVFVNSPLEVCEQRDKKGLYAKARSGEIKDFTGINAPFDIPENPDLELDTASLSEEETVIKAFEYILPRIQLKK
ncbi:MAG: adenylyl-sulfate kinase [Syntrophothermus sp.]